MHSGGISSTGCGGAAEKEASPTVEEKEAVVAAVVVVVKAFKVGAEMAGESGLL